MGMITHPFPLWFRALRKIGFGNLAWTMRKFILSVKKSDLVLEVGAGSHPFPRSDVLVDKIDNPEENQERMGNLPFDRPTFISEGENLPFRDKSFDFVIAVQVLEHSKYPEQFLKELERVASKGYIEVPDAISERLAPMSFHYSEITERKGKLIIRKKHRWNMDEEIEELWKRHLMWSKPMYNLTRRYPELFNVCYFWEGNIDFIVVNPDTPAFEAPCWNEVRSRDIELNPQRKSVYTISRKIKGILERFINMIYSFRRRKPDYLSILRCTVCNSTDFVREEKAFICQKCLNFYSIQNNCINLVKRDR